MHSEYLEACIEECCMQDQRSPSSVGRKLEPGELVELIFFQPAISLFRDCTHQINSSFPVARLVTKLLSIWIFPA